MVTMRRDVAVTKNVSSGYDGLTAYDKFIMKKNARRNEEVRNESKAERFFERISFAPNKKEGKKPNAAAERAPAPERSANEMKETAYDKYLLECLKNKSADERVMSSEEFYESILSGKQPKKSASKIPAAKTNVRAKKETRPSRFTKIGKIILSVYVLAVLFAAFTLVAVNVFNAEPVLADAEENPELGAKTIRPMTTETLEKEEESWFDSLCDAVKK